LDDARLAHTAVTASFLLTLRRAHRYRGGMPVKIWLFRIALQACRRLLPILRARRALRAAFAPRSISGGEISSLPRTAEEADLWLAVDRLAEPLRLPLLLYSVHALPAADIAQILGIHLETVQARLDRAGETIRKRLDLQPAGEVAFSSDLAPALAARWPPPDLSPGRLAEIRLEIENRRAGRGRLTNSPLSPRNLALGGLALLFIAAIVGASYRLFPDEDRVSPDRWHA
jgi:DNA-directed RNA polymerase specialized sigma24 family protein